MTGRQGLQMTPEMLAKIRGAKDAVQGQESKDIRCPRCGRLLAKKYSDARGHIQGKCDKCGSEFVIDLVSWRKRRG
jgi:DNA-directed RNA polymerase subunit RPC12/RpoP